MKIIGFFSLMLIISMSLCLPYAAEYDPYMQWGLPEGAKARLGKGLIREIAYSPDGRKLAVASSIGVWMYDAETGEELDLLTWHTRGVYSVAFSLDGNTIATGSNGDDTIRLWDVASGEEIQTLTGFTKGVDGLAFSPDGKTLAAGRNSRNGGDGYSWPGAVRLWDLQTGNTIRTLTDVWGTVYSLAFSPDGKTLAAGVLGPYSVEIPLWNVHNGRLIRTLTGHTSSVYSVSFSPDGTTLVSGSDDHTIRLWDVASGETRHTLTGHMGSVNSVSFSPDGTTLASGSGSWKDEDNTIRLWDVASGEEIQTLTGHTSSVRRVSFSPDGQTLASGSADEIRLWDVDTGNTIRTLTRHTGSGGDMSFSPDGNTIASGGWDEIRLWDVASGEEIQTLTGHMGSANSVSFSPDGTTLASGNFDHTIRLWDVASGEEIRTLIGHTHWVSSVSFSPDGQTLASGAWGDSDTIRLWNVSIGDTIHWLTGHTDNVRSVSFSPDGNTIASGSWDDTIRLWDVDTGETIRTLTGHTEGVESVSFSPDGKTIASGSYDHTIRLWDVASGEELHTLIGHTDEVVSVSFSPDGKTLASGSNDGTFRLWDVDTGETIRTLIGHTDEVRSVSFSPDGKTLASSDYIVLLWELTPSPTTTIPLSSTTVSISFTPVQSLAVGELLTLPITITNGANIAGYQATVSYDTAALRYVSSKNGDYLPDGAFFIPPVAEGNTVTLAASSLAGESNGDGTLATLTFEIVAVKASTVRLTNVLLTDSSGGSSVPQIENAEITEPPQLPADVNQDGIINIIDLTLVASNFGKTGQNDADVNGDGVVNIIDLTLVAAAFGNTAAAPEIWSLNLDSLTTRAEIEQWLSEARRLNLTDPTFQRGIRVLEQLLAALTAQETVLLPNYPNPFNPETWIPYQLAEPAEVSIAIYAADGKLVRTLNLGHQPIGIYTSRSHAAYWDGRNAFGEPVASSVYFYTLTAGKFTATRKMLIRK